MVDPSRQTARLSIDVIVVGGSITGLACAYTLSVAGHNVHVLEAEKSTEGHAVIHSPPNMTRILFGWGLGPDIEAQTKGRCPKIAFNSAYTGERLGELFFHQKVMDELGAEMFSLQASPQFPWYLRVLIPVKHADLVRLLFKRATNAGAQISFGTRVANIDAKTGTVTLTSGRKLQADLIVGADGHQSIVRSRLQLAPRTFRDVDYTTYLTSIPVSKVENDKEILELIRDREWHMWMGPRWGISTFGIRNNTMLSVTVFKDEKKADVHIDWSKRIPIEEIGLKETELAPILKRIMSLAVGAVRVKADRATSPESWYDSNGHVVIVGDAAHASIVGAVHAAAMGIEDAAVLGRLLSKLKSKKEIKRFLSAFQEIRRPRSEQIFASEQQKVDFITLPTGPLTRARDEAMCLQMVEGQADWSESEDSFLQNSWEEFRDVFGYDAYDAADTWWVEWGVLFDRISPPDETLSTDPFNGQIVVERERNTCIPEPELRL